MSFSFHKERVPIPNYVPYFVLSGMAVVLALISLWKTKSWKLLPCFFCLTGLTFLFELVIFVFFNSYEYFPMVLKDRYFDDIFGSNVSNGQIVPAAALFIAVFQLSFWPILFFAFGFMGIEWLFVNIGIYKHNWWNIYFTGVGLLFFFYLAKWIWRIVHSRQHQPFLQACILFFASVAVQGTLHFFITATFHFGYMEVPWFEDISRGHFAFITCYFIADSLLFVYLLVKRAPFILYGLSLIVLAVVNIILYASGILRADSLLGPIGFTALQALAWGILSIFQRIILEKENRIT